MKKFIVITGGAGFIGSNLIEHLLSKGVKNIISLDNYSSGFKKNEIKNKNVKYIRGNTNEIYSKLKKIKNSIETLFHFGEFARIHESFFKTKECFHSNISGTEKVFSFCLENKIKIIYSATSASLGHYGKDQSLSPYAFTKSKNLHLLMHLKKWFNLSYSALYFYNVYGPRQITKGKMATVIGIFENQFKQNKFLTVVKPGNQSRKFTHVQDTVNGCYIAWKKKLDRHYAITSSKSYKIIDVAKMFSGKIKFIKKKLGERNSSSLVSKVGNIKVYLIPCKTNLKTYINNFKKNI